MQGMLLSTDKQGCKRRELNQTISQGGLFQTAAGVLSYERLQTRSKILHSPRMR